MTRLQLGTNIALCVRGSLSQGDDLYEFLGGRGSIDCEDPVEQILVSAIQEIFSHGKNNRPAIRFHQDDTTPSSFRLDLSLWIGSEGGALNWSKPPPRLRGWNELNSGAAQNFGAGVLIENSSHQPNVQASHVRSLGNPARRSVQAKLSSRPSRPYCRSHSQDEQKHRGTKRKYEPQHPSPLQSSSKRVAIKQEPQQGAMAPPPLPLRSSPSVATITITPTPSAPSTGYVHMDTTFHPLPSQSRDNTINKYGTVDDILSSTISSKSYSFPSSIGSGEKRPALGDEGGVDFFAEFINDDDNNLDTARADQPLIDLDTREYGGDLNNMSGIKSEWGEATALLMEAGSPAQHTFPGYSNNETVKTPGNSGVSSAVPTQAENKTRRPLPTGRKQAAPTVGGLSAAAQPQRPKSPSPPSSAMLVTDEEIALLQLAD